MFGPGGGGPPFGGYGRGPDSGDPASRYEYFFRRMDRNGDGTIAPDELEGPAKQMFEGMAQRAGLDPSKPISLEKIRKAMEKRLTERDEDDGKPSSEKKKDAVADQPPLVPGFGLTQELPTVPGFGVRVPGYALGGTNSLPGLQMAGSGGASSSVSEQSKTDSKVRAYAKGIIEKYDRNKNGSLEKDEYEHMKSDPKEIDRNNDGVITEEELAARFMRDNPRQGGSSGLTSFASQKSYRLLSPLERLPDGLPDWFLDRDSDGDGQVAMHEFESFWTDSKAREFAWHDLNNDGVITPSECLEAVARGPEHFAESEPESRGPERVAVSQSESPPESRTERPSSGGGFWWME